MIYDVTAYGFVTLHRWIFYSNVLKFTFYSLQVTVTGNSTVAEVVCEPLQEAGAVVAGLPTGPLSAPQVVSLSGPLPPPAALSGPPAPPAALLFLGGSKAPVEPRASAAHLEGEVLVVEYQPPQWDGKDLETFIAWEKIYG